MDDLLLDIVSLFSNIFVTVLGHIDFFQSSLMFLSSSDQIVAVWMESSVSFQTGWFRTLEYCRMKVLFPHSRGIILLFRYIFQILLIPSLSLFYWRQGISLCGWCFGTLKYSRTKVPFLIIAEVVLIFWQFFQILLI